jgi:hypothetical protein
MIHKMGMPVLAAHEPHVKLWPNSQLLLQYGVRDKRPSASGTIAKRYGTTTVSPDFKMKLPGSPLPASRSS